MKVRAITSQLRLISIISFVTAAPAFAQQSPRSETLRRFPTLGCHSNSHKCQAVCDAAAELKTATDDLSTCAGRADYDESCDRQFRDVRDAHDALESAVSEADGDCE